MTKEESGRELAVGGFCSCCGYPLEIGQGLCPSCCCESGACFDTPTKEEYEKITETEIENRRAK